MKKNKNKMLTAKFKCTYRLTIYHTYTIWICIINYNTIIINTQDIIFQITKINDFYKKNT